MEYLTNPVVKDQIYVTPLNKYGKTEFTKPELYQIVEDVARTGGFPYVAAGTKLLRA